VSLSVLYTRNAHTMPLPLISCVQGNATSALTLLLISPWFNLFVLQDKQNNTAMHAQTRALRRCHINCSYGFAHASGARGSARGRSPLCRVFTTHEKERIPRRSRIFNARSATKEYTNEERGGGHGPGSSGSGAGLGRSRARSKFSPPGEQLADSNYY